MMIWLPQTNPSNGSAQTVITRTFQTPLTRPTRRMLRRIISVF